MTVLEVCLHDDVGSGLHRFERGLLADAEASAAKMIEVFGLMPESSFDKRVQPRIIPVRTFDLAARSAQIQHCQMPAREMPGEIGRG